MIKDKETMAYAMFGNFFICVLRTWSNHEYRVAFDKAEEEAGREFAYDVFTIDEDFYGSTK